MARRPPASGLAGADFDASGASCHRAGMEDALALGAREVPAGRDFTAPDRTQDDLVGLRQMASALREVIGRPAPPTPRPLILEVGGPPGPGHRVIVCDEARLRAPVPPGLVGFFAEKRPDMDHAPLTRTDDALVAEFPAHPGVLAYCSLELADGNWGNLVVVAGSEARERWREGPTHAYAAGELAPRHYTVIRLRVGRFSSGLVAGGEPVIDETRYYDFRGATPWRATRRLEVR